MHTIEKTTVHIAMFDQLRRTRIKHAVDQLKNLHLIGDSINTAALLQLVQYRLPDIVLLDLNLDVGQIKQLAEQIKARSPETKIMLLDVACRAQDIFDLSASNVLGHGGSDMDARSLELAVESIRRGAVWVSAEAAERASQRVAAPLAPEKKMVIDSDILGSLSERERQVLKLLVAGHKNFAIAQALEISPETIKSHMRRIMDKLCVRDRTQLVIKVLCQGAA